MAVFPMVLQILLDIYIFQGIVSKLDIPDNANIYTYIYIHTYIYMCVCVIVTHN